MMRTRRRHRRIASNMKKIHCYGCDFEGVKAYNVKLGKWSRKFKCPKCGSESFRWYNF